MESSHNAEVIHQLSDWIEAGFQTLEEIRLQFAHILDEALLPTAPLRVDEPTRARLFEVAAHYLAEVKHFDGTGLIFQRQLVAEQTSALEWWVREGDGPRRQDFVNDPNSAQFYDYEQLEWFRGGFGAEARTIAGPYIDHFGVKDYITTWTIPLMVHNKTVGVVAADVKIAVLEQVLIPKLLRASKGRAALVNETGQVIVSTIGPFSSGTLVETAPDGYTLLLLPVSEMELSLLVEAE